MTKTNIIKRILAFTLVLGLVLSLSLVRNDEAKINSEETKISSNLNKNEYNTTLKEISSTQTIDEVNIVEFSVFYNSSDNFNVTSTNLILDDAAITNVQETSIIRIDSAIDFYAFTLGCNRYPKLRGLNYILGSDIDYSDQSRYGRFIEPIVKFSGTFDGQGYTISNLFFERLDQDKANQLDVYYGGSIISLSLFIENTGIIKNFGIIDTYNLQIQLFNQLLTASTVVGINKGTIENIYVNDLRGESSGLVCEGGYLMSSFVGVNETTGTIKNCYVAVNRIALASVQEQSQSSCVPIIIENKGTIIDSYFDSSVLNQTYNTSNTMYAKTKAEINAKFVSIDGWHTIGNYPTSYQSLFTNQYPNLMGLNHVIIDSKIYFLIENHIDFAYFNKLIKTYGAFRNASYLLVENINLAILNSESLEPCNIPFTGSFETGYKEAGTNGYTINLNGHDYSKNLTLSDGSKSKNHFIYNANIKNGVSYDSKQSFGLFPILSGTLKNIDIYNINVTINNSSNLTSEEKEIGLLCGYLNKGVVRNCNVYGTITVDSTNANQNIGMISGYATKNARIEASTSNGNLNASSCGSVTSIGGILGNVTSSDVINVLNKTTINYVSPSLTVAKLGGVLGSGVLERCENLENQGIINVASNTNLNGYIAGIVGLIEGSNKDVEVGRFSNKGNITISKIDTDTKMYASGVCNVKMSNSSELNICALTNYADFSFQRLNTTAITMKRNYNTFGDNTTGDIDLHVCGNLFVIASNVNATAIYRKGTGTQEIDISIISEYAPCVRTHDSNGNNTSYKVNVTDSINFRDIYYKTTSNVNFHDLKLSGCISGSNVNLNRCRNEGNLTVDFSHYSTNALNYYRSGTDPYSINKTLALFGVCETLSEGMRGQNLYNGGNITVKSSVSTTYSRRIKYHLYISGICNKNEAGTLENDMSRLVLTNLTGAITNSINAGNIEVQGTSSNYFFGVSRVGGICAYNKSTITNCYNLGNIYNRNYVVSGISSENSDQEGEVESGGIVFFMLGDNAAIVDCANNGTIISQNLSSTSSWVNAAGIIARNDKFEDGTDLGGNSTGHNHHTQKVEFSINYGDIYALNNQVTNQGNTETRCKASGIISLGLCTIINVINYGNVYSVDTAGAMYGLVFMQKFGKASSASPVYIANALNYGKIRRISKISTNITNYTPTVTENNTWYQVGALIGYIKAVDNSTATSLSKVKISYLINFDDRVDMVGDTDGFTNVESAIDTINSTLQYMATLKVQDTSESPFGVSTTYGTGIKSYSLDNATGTKAVTSPYNANYYTASNNGGIFNENYQLRHPVTNTGMITDEYISDYFQYVGYSKVNEYLLHKLGLGSTVFEVAYESLFSSYSNLSKILNNSSQYGLTTQVISQKYTENIISNNAINTLLQNYKSEILEVLKQNITNTINDKKSYLVNNIPNTHLFDNLNETQIINDAIIALSDQSVNELMIQLFNTTSFSNYYNNYTSNLLNWLDNYTDSIYDEYYRNIYDVLVAQDSFSTKYGVTYDEFAQSPENYLNVYEDFLTSMDLNNQDYVTFINEYSSYSQNDSNVYLPATSTNNKGKMNEYYVKYGNYGYEETSIMHYIGECYGLSGNSTFDSTDYLHVYIELWPDFETEYGIQYGFLIDNGVEKYRVKKTNENEYWVSPYNTYIYVKRNEKNMVNSQNVNVEVVEFTDFTYRDTMPVSTSTSNFNTLKTRFTELNNDDRLKVLRHMIECMNTKTNAKTAFINLVTSSQSSSTTGAPSPNFSYNAQSLIEYLKTYYNQLSNEQKTVVMNNLYSILNNNYNNISKDAKLHFVRNTNETEFLKKIINTGAITDENITNMYFNLLLSDTNTFSNNDLINQNIKTNLLGLYVGSKTSLSEKVSTFNSIINNISNVIVPSPESNTLDDFKNYLGKYGINSSDFLDYTGIYALASSQGILNGQFIPDNLVLTDIDPVTYNDNGTIVTDSSWRNYNDTDSNKESKVDYKVHVMMKQLKLSISTSVFKVTLKNNDGYTFNNDMEKDYDLSKHEIKFYVPKNDDLFKNNSSITIYNDSEYYELAYNAIIPINTCNLLSYTSVNEGNELRFTFNVQAEDRTVETTYTVIIYVTGDKSINGISNVNVNNSQSTYTSTPTEANINTSVNANGGIASFDCTIVNVSDNYNPTNYIKLYKQNNGVYEIVDENYVFTIGNVVSNTTNTSKSFNVKLNCFDSLSSGNYQIRCYINDPTDPSSTYYPIKISKAKSSANAILSVTTLDGITHNINSTNQTIDVPVGIEYTTNFFVPNSIVTSPLSTCTYVSGHMVTTYTDATVLKRYEVKYTVTAEDSTTQNYTIYLQEAYDELNPSIFKGGISYSGDLIFSKDETPDYSFEFDLKDFSLNGNGRFEVLETSSLNDNGFTLAVVENGFTITFGPNAESGTYTFNYIFKKEVQYTQADNTVVNLNWYYTVYTVNITKDYNKNSYFDNITFISETVLTSLDTKVSDVQINKANYDTTDSKAQSLPNKIYYNDLYNESGNIYKEELYVVGVVNKTDLTNYSPTFTLPNDGKVYRIEEIMVNNIPTLCKVRDCESGYIYEGLDGSYYRLTGTSYVQLTDLEVNALVYKPTDGLASSYSLYTNFISLTDDFKYVQYRLYSEEQLQNSGNSVQTRAVSMFYTDFFIAVIDSTNVIDFRISFSYTSVAMDNVYFEFLSYELDNNDNKTDILQSRMGKLASFDNQTNMWVMNKFQISPAGYYYINLELPQGYEYILKVTDKSTVTYYASNDNVCEVVCKGDILSRELLLEFTIYEIGTTLNAQNQYENSVTINGNTYTMIETPKKWGVNYENESQNVEAQN